MLKGNFASFFLVILVITKPFFDIFVIFNFLEALMLNSLEFGWSYSPQEMRVESPRGKRDMELEAVTWPALWRQEIAKQSKSNISS